MDIEPQPEDDTILEQTFKFRSLTDSLKSQFSDLIALRKEKQDRESPVYSNLYSSILYNLTSMRSNHRVLYQEIEKNRIKNQKEKDTLDENICFLECLNYQANSLNGLISGCQSFQTPALDRIKEVKKSLEKFKKVSQEEELHTLNEEVLQIIKKEYEARKELKSSFEDLEQKKTLLVSNCEEKQRFITKLPNEIKKISELMKDFMDIFKINESLHPEQGLLAKQLPSPLHNIYYKFSGLSLSRIDPNLSITIIRKDKPESGKYKMDPLELVLLLEETPERKQTAQATIKRFRFQNMDLSSIYPIRLYIRYLVECNIVVLQLDNKNFFTTEEVLTDLVPNDHGTQIFTNPANEQERNVNNKYQFYRFLQSLGGNASFSKPQALTAQLAVKIRTRVFSRIVLKCLLEDVKKDFFGTLNNFASLELKTFEKPVLTDKNILKSIAEINKEEYHAGLRLPDAFRKKLEPKNNEDLVENKGILECLEEILREKEEKKIFENYEASDELVSSVFGVNHSEDHAIYLKIEAEIRKQFEVTVFVKIPADYPFESAKCTVYTTRTEEKTTKIPDFLAGKTRKLTKIRTNSNKTALSPQETSTLEGIVNKELPRLARNEKSEDFGLILQLQTIFGEVARILKEKPEYK